MNGKLWVSYFLLHTFNRVLMPNEIVVRVEAHDSEKTDEPKKNFNEAMFYPKLNLNKPEV